MPHSGIQINEGTGKFLAHWRRTIGAVDYEEQKTVASEPFVPTYVVGFTTAIPFVTANTHVFQLMSGAGMRTLIRRIKLWQVAVAAAAAVKQMQIVTLTTAGSGGSSYTARAMDAADGVATATAMTNLDGAGGRTKGTEGFVLHDLECAVWSAVPTTGPLAPLVDERFDTIHAKSLAAQAGTGNGFALKLITGDGGTPAVRGFVEFSEADWS